MKNAKEISHSANETFQLRFDSGAVRFKNKKRPEINPAF